jgi:serine/threonine-protein kinase
MSEYRPPRDPYRRPPHIGDTLVEHPGPPERPPSRFLDYLPWILIAILGVALAAVIGVWFATRGTPKKPVPTVIGLPIDAAVIKLQGSGFKIATEHRANGRPAWTIVGQVPEAGLEEPKGSVVQLVVSRGRALATVPNAVGEKQTTARSALVGAGFIVTSAEVFSDQPIGTVVAQAPPAGQRAKPGTKVRINISKGSATVDVPSELGKQGSEARVELGQLGLSVAIVQVPSDQPAGTVVAQAPASGPVRHGSKVRLNVSAGPTADTTTTNTTTTDTTGTTTTGTTGTSTSASPG